VLDRRVFGECLLTCHGVLGWMDDGVPTAETLLDHNLDEA
jgi:hypothetical protein